MVHTCNPHTFKAERELRDSLGYIRRHCLKTTERKEEEVKLEGPQESILKYTSIRSSPHQGFFLSTYMRRDGVEDGAGVPLRICE